MHIMFRKKYMATTKANAALAHKLARSIAFGLLRNGNIDLFLYPFF